MKKKIVILAIALIAVIAVVAVAAATLMSPPQSNPSPSTNPAATNPTATNPTTPPAPTPTPTIPPTAYTSTFNPTVAVNYMTIQGTPNPMSYFNTTTSLSSGSFQFNINVTNPTSSSDSPTSCNIEVVVTEKDKTTATANDVLLGVYTMGQNPNTGQPDPSMAYYMPINSTVNGNQVIFQFAPGGNYSEPYIQQLSATGFSVPAGLSETFDTMLVLKNSGHYDLAVNLVQA